MANRKHNKKRNQENKTFNSAISCNGWFINKNGKPIRRNYLKYNL